jgi:tetratricopeptide (TPR) repeat protein
VLLNLGTVQLNRGLLDTASDHLVQAISLFQRARCEDVVWNRQNDDIGVSSALLCMAQISIQQNRLQEAMDRINNALKLIRRVNGEKSCEAATALCQVGRVYQKQGHLDASFKMFRRALRYRKRTLGDQHVHVATSMVLVAGVHIIRKEFDDALVLLEGAAGIQQAAFGDYHLSLEKTYCDMAQCWEGLEDTTNESAIMEKLQGLYAALGRTADVDDVATILAGLKT